MTYQNSKLNNLYGKTVCVQRSMRKRLYVRCAMLRWRSRPIFVKTSDQLAYLGQHTRARPDHRTVSKSSPYIRAPVHATAVANATTRSASGRMRLSRRTSLDMAPNSILSVTQVEYGTAYARQPC
jgi:hypothetical protein